VTTALRAIVEYRDDLVNTRTLTVNRLHLVLTNLVVGGAGRNLSSDHAAERLRGVRPRDTAGYFGKLRDMAVSAITPAAVKSLVFKDFGG
jgi:hypothetical protein